MNLHDMPFMCKLSLFFRGKEMDRRSQCTKNCKKNKKNYTSCKDCYYNIANYLKRGENE